TTSGSDESNIRQEATKTIEPLDELVLATSTDISIAIHPNETLLPDTNYAPTPYPTSESLAFHTCVPSVLLRANTSPTVEQI
ncbi:3839_t:CDS:2, partial [Funneliformis caledonium]